MSLINFKLLEKHIKDYLENIKANQEEATEHLNDRRQRSAYYRSWTREKILAMEPEEIFEYFSKLFAMLIWGNKQYYVDKLIDDNGIVKFRENLADLAWGSEAIERRWDTFRKNIKGIGPAMMSEILCYIYPEECMIWNRRAYVAYDYLGIADLPKYNYQFTGKVYKKLSSIANDIATELKKKGIEEPNLLAVDYFIWEELQVAENLNQIFKKSPESTETVLEEKIDLENGTSDFIHNEIRDKIAEIGTWLGFSARTERKIAEGAKVDSIWEATIGNMGRVIYVFEVQTKGSIDSLILNLLKSLNNPAVQGVVAVSDSKQLEKIKKHCEEVQGFQNKIRFWDYKRVLEVHEALELVNENINGLQLVPQGFSI